MAVAIPGASVRPNNHLSIITISIVGGGTSSSMPSMPVEVEGRLGLLEALGSLLGLGETGSLWVSPQGPCYPHYQSHYSPLR